MVEQTERSKQWEERLNEAGTRFETELRRVVRYIDDEVVPEVRRQSSTALRKAAAELQRLAETMDDRSGPRSAGPTGSAGV